ESEATRSSNKSLSFSKDLVFGPHQLYFSGLSLNRVLPVSPVYLSIAAVVSRRSHLPDFRIILLPKEIQLAAGATVFTPTST
ncbi:hypothetical protein BHM03_00061788, partial [Ensete ventricosum]